MEKKEMVKMLQEIADELYGHPEEKLWYVNDFLSRPVSEALCDVIEKVLVDLWRCDFCGKPAYGYRLIRENKTGPMTELSLCEGCMWRMN